MSRRLIKWPISPFQSIRSVLLRRFYRWRKSQKSCSLKDKWIQATQTNFAKLESMVVWVHPKYRIFELFYWPKRQFGWKVKHREESGRALGSAVYPSNPKKFLFGKLISLFLTKPWCVWNSCKANIFGERGILYLWTHLLEPFPWLRNASHISQLGAVKGKRWFDKFPFLRIASCYFQTCSRACRWLCFSKRPTMEFSGPTCEN